MEGIEIEGKTIDEAIEKACVEFKVPREKLNIEIISEGNPGFLGIGSKKARIRAGLLSIEMTLDDVFTRNETVTVPAPVQTERAAVSIPKANEGANGADRRRVRTAAPAPKARPEAQRTPAAATLETGEPVEPENAAKPHASPAAADNGESAAQKAKRILEGLLTRMTIPSPVTVEETDEAIVLNIQGDGSGLLIGKRGQNLDAIQYILNKAVHHTANGHKMITIDTEAYRKRREESLVALAVRLGEKVKKTQKPVTVGHMNAHDRRVIHMAMQNDEALTTKSRGEGEYRKIVILPARRGPDHPDA
jgi:spoIIIJ-associated protein